MHTTHRSLLRLGLTSALLIAACGGGAGASGGAGPGASAGASTGPGGGTPGPAATQSGGGVATPAPVQGGTVDACAVLTGSDIREITGHDVVRSQPGTNFGIYNSGCEWELADASAIVPPSVTLGINAPGGRSYWDRYFKPFITDEIYDPIEGVGDEAYAGFGNTATVIVGDTYFQVQYIGSPKGAEVDIARRVVENLGG